MVQTAKALIARKQRPAAVYLAWQCWQVGDPALADNLLAAALDGITDDRERLQTALAGVEFLFQTHQLRRTEQLLDSLLNDPKFAGRSSLWRLGAALAAERRRTARSRECLERAVDIDFQRLPDVIDLDAVRKDFGLLLNQYLHMTEAFASLGLPARRELIANVVRAADRWRVLDPDDPTACPSAAQVLHVLGAKDLAWDYLNNPIAVFPPDPDSWLELAKGLNRQEDFDLAELAYAQAVEADPADAQALWERAQNLERAGRPEEAQKVYLRLAEGQWPSRFAWIREEARRRVQGR
jgi:tetratricopeptide (TPR) repeat protein